MDIKKIEARLAELKSKQAEHFKVKKEARNSQNLEAIRTEMNSLKDIAHALYRKRPLSEEQQNVIKSIVG